MTAREGVVTVAERDEPAAGEHDAVIEVGIAGGETIRIEADREGLWLSNADRWEQRLTRQEAWRLAEAIDEAATRDLPR